MIMRGKDRLGDMYFCYIYRGRQNHTCDSPTCTSPRPKRQSRATTPPSRSPAIGTVLDRLDHSYRLTSERAHKTLNLTIFIRLYADANDRPARIHEDEPSTPFTPAIAGPCADSR
jgi:hypothetical protein